MFTNIKQNNKNKLCNSFAYWGALSHLQCHLLPCNYHHTITDTENKTQQTVR